MGKQVMRLTKMIYVASPYSHPSEIVRLGRYEFVTKLIGQLQDHYPYAFIGPITQSHHTAKYMLKDNTEFVAWARRDLTYISRCNEVWVVMMDGWKESKGVIEEILFAETHAIRVRYFNPETNKFTRKKKNALYPSK